MSWLDPCSTCELHRADCECHKSTKNIYLGDEVGHFPFHNNQIGWDLASQKPKGIYSKTEKLTIEQIKRKEDFINSPLKYLETLPKAYEIYEKLLGEPKTHREWADRFNKVGDINEIIMRK